MKEYFLQYIWENSLFNSSDFQIKDKNSGKNQDLIQLYNEYFSQKIV